MSVTVFHNPKCGTSRNYILDRDAESASEAQP